MKLPELQNLAKENKIRGFARLNKPELVELLIEKGLIPSDTHSGKMNFQGLSAQEYRKNYQKIYQKEYWKDRRTEGKVVDDGRCDRLRTIRNNPRRVEILDKDTGDTVVYSSMYKAGKAHGQSAQLISAYNGKVWRNRFEIKIYDDSSL